MTDAKLDFWIQNNYNVLFQGKHGVGKTARIVEAFNQHNLKWRYFSASTLDPWVDFVGVPKEVIDPSSGKAYLDLVRPKHFADDEVEAIFMDEYNRAPAKIRNATMELLQFKSINGKKFNNLRFIWAAINPEKELENDSAPEYDVDKIDPAQRDRFEIHVEVPYKPDIAYFKNKYGEDIGKTCVNWWNDLNEKEKDEVSPRRLDYAMSVYIKGGDIRDVLSKKVNVSKLISELKNGNFRELMEDIFKTKNHEKANTFMKDENSYNNTIKYIVQNKHMVEFFFPYIPEEKQSNLISSEETVMKYTFNHMDKYDNIIKRATIANTKVQKALQKFNRSKPLSVDNYAKFTFSSPTLMLTKAPKNMYLNQYQSYTDMVNQESKYINTGTAYRRNVYKLIVAYLYYNRNFLPLAGMNNNEQKVPLEISEIQLTLSTLNAIIESTYTYTSFVDIEKVYGIINAEYIRKFGMRQDYAKLPRKVREFLNANANYYV
jgi:hypothetical protein